MEQEESIFNLVNGLFAVGGGGGLTLLVKLGYNFINNGFESIKQSHKAGFDEIKKDLNTQKQDITNLSDRFNGFNLTIQKIDFTMTSVERDLDKANENLGKTNNLAVRNEKLIEENKHQIEGIKINLTRFIEIVEKYDEKIIDLSKKVFILENEKK